MTKLKLAREHLARAESERARFLGLAFSWEELAEKYPGEADYPKNAATMRELADTEALKVEMYADLVGVLLSREQETI